jgi:beta-lactamase regulating signal transducer with metallopeptidase domain/uncharacterized protein involved in exopolysaccharide biosynthesis
MKLLLDLFHHPLTHRVGWALLHSLWQGAFVAVLFGLLRFALRRASARARYFAACLSLLLLAAAPAITVLLMTNSNNPASGGGYELGSTRNFAAVAVENSTVVKAGHKASLFIYQVAEILERIVPWLVAVWFAGVLLCGARWAKGYQRIRSLKTLGTSAVDPGWIEMLEDLKCRIQVSRPVQLLKSACVEVPTVIGWLRPVILLPASSLTGLTPSQLEAILAHELAHICRHDYLINAFQNVVETLMFYHPAVWWISRCIREEREHCCDDLAVKVCGSRVDYARALAAMEQLRVATPAFALAATGGTLLFRIRRLLGLPDGGQSSGRQAVGLTLLGTGLALVIAGVALIVVPARYEAAARLRIEGESAPPNGDDAKSKTASAPGRSQTALAILSSPLILNQVIQNLALRETWSKRYGRELAGDAALKLLQQRTSARPVPNTSLLDIHASSENPEEAANIANEIVRVYSVNEKNLASEMIERGIKAMHERLAKENKSVNDAQLKVDRMRTELNINDPDWGSLVPTPTLSVETVQLLRNQYAELKQEEVKQETQLRVLTKLDAPNLRDSIQTSLDSPDPVLSTLINELDLADQKLRTLERDFTKDHPAYQNALKVREDLDKKIDKRIQGILLGIQNRLEATRARLDELNKRFETARTNDLAMVEHTRPYFEAKRQLAELVQFKQILAMKIASEETDLKLPKNPLVYTVDAATVPSEPTYPNRSTAAGLITFGALSGIAGLVVLRSKRTPQLAPHPA